MRKKSLTLIGADLRPDSTWMIKQLSPEFHTCYFDASDKNINTVDKNSLIVFVHAWITGRLEPLYALDTIHSLKSNHGISINGLLVLISKGTGGVQVPLLSLEDAEQKYEVKPTEVDAQQFSNLAQLVSLLNNWDSKRTSTQEALSTVSSTYSHSPSGLTPRQSHFHAAAVNSNRDQATISAQQKRIEDLEETVRLLTQRVEQVEAKLKIQPANPKKDPEKTTNSWFW